jgi:hypothetical protein
LFCVRIDMSGRDDESDPSLWMVGDRVESVIRSAAKDLLSRLSNTSKVWHRELDSSLRSE